MFLLHQPNSQEHVVTALATRLRELEVKDLLALTRFFSFSLETFALAISFVGSLPLSNEDLAKAPVLCGPLLLLHHISQNHLTASDVMRTEKIIMEKLHWKVKAPTALSFLRLLHSHIQEQLKTERDGAMVGLPILVFSGHCQVGCMVLRCEHIVPEEQPNPQSLFQKHGNTLS